jgi:hypothetical protein
MADLLTGVSAVAGAGNSLRQPKVKLSNHEELRERRARSCALDGCRTLTYRSTDYCWKHQDTAPTEPEPEAEPDSEADTESGWWEGQPE